jgi:hypothetical protein
VKLSLQHGSIFDICLIAVVHENNLQDKLDVGKEWRGLLESASRHLA